MAMRVQGGEMVPVESAAEVLSKNRALKSSHPSMLLAQQLSQRFGGSPPRMADTTTSVYFTIMKGQTAYIVRVSDHMNTPRRQGGGGSEVVNVNIATSMGYQSASSVIEKAMQPPAQHPFTIKVGDMVRVGYANLRVQAVKPEQRSYLVHIPGRGTTWLQLP